MFTPERVAIANHDGTVVEALDQPRPLFAGHALQTPRSTVFGPGPVTLLPV